MTSKFSTWKQRCTRLCGVVACFVCVGLVGQPLLAEKTLSDSVAEADRVGEPTSVGTEGTYFVRSAERLAVRPYEETGALLVRIADIAEDGDSWLHEVRYIGFYPGDYDLREQLMHLDGSELTEGAPANIRVVSVLPKDHDGQLSAGAEAPLPWTWPYRTMLLVLSVIWAVPLVWFGIRQFARRPAEATATTVEPTLADQLHPLVVAVLDGNSTAQQQAELERLLLTYWRAKLDLESCSTQEALTKMRRDPEAGELLRQLERWLYARRGREAVDVAGLLAPYRSMAAVPMTGTSRLPAVAASEGNGTSNGNGNTTGTSTGHSPTKANGAEVTV